MRFERLDLNLLVALDSLLELRSVSLTARRHNLTQPAVSAALSRLREFFDDELLVSTGRIMVPTAKADELRAPVREMLILVRSRITTPARFVPAQADRKFVICGSDYSFDVLLSRALKGLSVEAPALTFDFVLIDHRAEERLERGEIDIYLTISNYAISGHPREKLWDDEHCVIAWSEGEFGASLSELDFSEAGHAEAYFGPEYRPSIAELHYQDLAIFRRIEIKVPSFSQLPGCVVGTNRLATLHRRHAEYYARSQPLTLHPLPMRLPGIVEEMQWHTLRSGDQGITYVRNFISRCARDMSGEQSPAEPG